MDISDVRPPGGYDFSTVVVIVIGCILGYKFFMVFGVGGFSWCKRWCIRKFISPQRFEYIKRHRFGTVLSDKVRELHPRLSMSDVEKVFEGLRQFFLIAHYAKGEVAMPSRVADDAWHQFILFTDDYSRFCNGAFGEFFHHKPYARNQDKEDGSAVSTTSLRTWIIACQLEGIDCEDPERLPHLFSLDSDLEIDNGNMSALDSEQIVLYREATRAYRKSGGSGGPFFLAACGGGGCSGGGSCGGGGWGGGP
ncbi:MAG: hypothetical protein VX733_10115 [Candidatus Latescibacterota bacterium]|nr:hypothetical protein [Candidatus Latescibacterota bacterium]